MSEEIFDVSVTTEGGDIPFSIGYLANALLATGISHHKAYEDAFAIALTVAETGKSNFSSDEIMNITINWYKEKNDKIAKRLKAHQTHLKDIRPIVILFGGVTGIGKSTLAQLFATRLGVKSIIGTDLIREVLRVTISSDLMPTLHTSSYTAYKNLDTTFLPALSKPIVGFEEQARTVIVGIEAAIEQAIEDKEFLIIEGVHLVPGLIKENVMNSKGVVAFQCILTDQTVHKSRLKRRESKTHSRGTHYSDYFEEICEIQEYLIEQAKIHAIPTIEVDDDEIALETIINHFWEQCLE